MLNIEFLFIFILAHLTADFVLQTNKIARLKSEATKGVLIHSGIVCGVHILFLGIYGWAGIAAGLLGAGVHFCIDSAKKVISKYLSRLQFLYFVFDQFLHLAVILLLTKIFAPEDTLSDYLIGVVVFLIGLILVSYVSTVAAKILLLDLFPPLSKEGFFIRNERALDAVFSLFLLGVFLIPNDFIRAFVIVLFFFIFYYVHKRLFPYKTGIVLLKYGFYVFGAGIVSLLMLHKY